jgi:plasmid stabilization system protein ParE
MSRRPHVRLTGNAEDDLADIYFRRLTQRGASGKDGADALLNRLTKVIEGLAEWPLRGSFPPELEALGNHDFRQLSLPPFRIVYRPALSDEDAIIVLVVADARRDFETLLQERLLG